MTTREVLNELRDQSLKAFEIGGEEGKNQVTITYVTESGEKGQAIVSLAAGNTPGKISTRDQSGILKKEHLDAISKVIFKLTKENSLNRYLPPNPKVMDVTFGHKIAGGKKQLIVTNYSPEKAS
jgi:hypothetical protein